YAEAIHSLDPQVLIYYRVRIVSHTAGSNRLMAGVSVAANELTQCRIGLKTVQWLNGGFPAWSERIGLGEAASHPEPSQQLTQVTFAIQIVGLDQRLREGIGRTERNPTSAPRPL